MAALLQTCHSTGLAFTPSIAVLQTSQANAAVPRSFSASQQHYSTECCYCTQATRRFLTPHNNPIVADKTGHTMQLRTASPMGNLPQKHQRKGVVYCDADDSSSGFDPAQLRRDMERLKKQEEKKKTQRRQKILEAADPSPSKSTKRTLSEAVSEARGFGTDALQQDLERIRGLEEKGKASKAGRDGPGVSPVGRRLRLQLSRKRALLCAFSILCVLPPSSLSQNKIVASRHCH